MTNWDQAPIAVGDLHGRADLLWSVTRHFRGHNFVFLGDYVDRGPQSREVIDEVQTLVEEGRAVALRGNHDQWMIEYCAGQLPDPDIWLMQGGMATVGSFRKDRRAMAEAAAWLEANTVPQFISHGVLFTHGMRPDPDGQDERAWMWGRPTHTPLYPLPYGCTASVHGHTPLPAPQAIADGLGHLAWFIDTAAYTSDVLTALDTEYWDLYLFKEGRDTPTIWTLQEMLKGEKNDDAY